MPKTQQEIVSQGYQALVNSLGVVDAIRFIQHCTPGQGDYTHDRHQWLDKTPLEDILTAIRQRQEDDPNQYDEIIE
ncbi:hypothetical protein [Stenomitos frigidus]|uniref:Uncharacterized protein n=1 Tax=Stenomitos frigidus ULC18 TaxID=2107698 RepID=A0A2T1EF59_9CYAN|nr:hypothetical protein [Stenomitos frigidus]PSB31396.1 hypothetical protein C7B82_07425 [Stenomitos frigidus ULC18]